MANPRKFSEKIALHNQKQAEETAAFEEIMKEVSAATNKPEETNLAIQYGMGCSPGRSNVSPSRSPGPRGRASSSVGPMRNRPAERKHDTSPYGSTVYLSPPPDSSWRRTNSDSALHQSCNEQPPSPALSPHHPHHSHAHPHHVQHHHHRRSESDYSPTDYRNWNDTSQRTPDIHLDMIASMTSNNNTRPRSSCNQRIPNNLNMYESSVTHTLGTDGAGETQLPGGSLPDLTALQPHPHPAYRHHTHTHQHRNNSPGYTHHSPTSGGSLSPATGGLSPASGSPQGATVPLPSHDAQLYDSQVYVPMPIEGSPRGREVQEDALILENMSPIDHSWITSTYQSHQSHCSPPSQYSSTSNINIPSPTMLHSPGSPVEVPQSDYSNLHQALLQPFEQITMGDHPPSNSYTSSYINHSSPVSPQPNSPQTYSQQNSQRSSPGVTRCGDPVAGAGVLPPSLTSPTTPNTPASIPDIILTDYSSEFEAGIFGGEEAQLRAGLDLDELTLLEEPSSLLPDSSVEHEFQLEGT